ncbi:GxxExxY protein [Runella sp.]|uniref:GxxExxY protein n=2 Tax=Runella sp. TaxID=1960881 RepID=UPI0030160999
MTENEISYIVRGCIFKVFNNLGPGLLESAYEAALLYEIEKTGLNVKSQVALPMIYETIRVDIGYRLDLLIEGKIVIELKSVETLLDVHHKQLITYLKLSGLKLGLLVNFNTDDISKSIFRKVNGLRLFSAAVDGRVFRRFILR